MLALLPLPLAAAAVAGSIVAASAAVYPPLVLTILAFSVPLQDSFVLPIAGLTLTATEAALGLAVLAWFFSGALHRELRLSAPWLLAPLGIFVAALVASTSAAPVLQLGLKEAVKWMEFGVVVVLGVALLKTPRDVIIVSAGMLLAGVGEALYGLNQAGAGVGPLGFLLGGGILRAFGHFGQPNPFAAYAAMTAVLALGLVVALVSRDPRSLLRPWGIAIAAVLLTALAAIVASFSRSALFAVATGMVFIVGAKGGRALLGLGLGGLGAAALWLFGASELLPPVLTGRLSIVFDYFSVFDARQVVLTADNFAIVQRMAIWQSAWEMFLDNPLLGVGLGNFDHAYPAYSLPGWLHLPGHAHNYYLNLLAETGILGLSAYLALLLPLAITSVVCARTVGRTAVAAADKTAGALLYGVALAFPGLLAMLTVHHLFDNLYVHGMIVHVALALCLALAARRIAGGQGQVRN